ncbi:MAG: hypothetical protein KC609_06330 [Myxococcales bacterium]|nr:hypothetical protein [Myxococcales bacterium]
MKRYTLLSLLAAALLACVACGSSSKSTTEQDTTTAQDTTTPSDTNNGTPDTSIQPDFTITLPDGSAQPDTSTTTDTAQFCTPTVDFLGCSETKVNENDYSASLQASPIEITFAQYSYTPPCIKVKKGQVVRFKGADTDDTFDKFYLFTKCGPDNVLDKNTKSLNAAEFQLNNVGIYNYIAFDYEVTYSMGGVIVVVD